MIRLSRVFIGILLLASTGTLCAQSNRGTITGTVTDPSGAAIPSATITATNMATGISTGTASSSSGNYTIPLLQVGTYQVTAARPGFKKFVAPHVVLEVGQTVTVDIHMEVGAVTQTIEVNGAASLLQRDTSDRSTVVASRDVEELPIVSQGEQRNPGFYMTLAPGVTGRGTATPTASGS